MARPRNGRIAIGSLPRWQARDRVGSGPRPLAATGTDIDRPVRDDEAERGADGALDEADVAAVRAHQFCRDREPKPGAAAPGRALEGLEQMSARFLRNAGAGVGDFDRHDRAFAPSGDAQLIAARLVRRARFEGLERIAREIEDHAEELLGVRINVEPALDRGDPANG